MSQEANLYHGERTEILRCIPDNSQRILDIGCSSGDLGKAIKRQCKATVIGIEINPQAAREAQK